MNDKFTRSGYREMDYIKPKWTDETPSFFRSWYDNEWGYSCSVVDLIEYMVKKGL